MDRGDRGFSCFFRTIAHFNRWNYHGSRFFMAASWKVLAVAAPIIAGITAALLALWVAYDDFAAYLEERPSLFGPVWEKMLQAVNWVTDKWNAMMRFFQDSLLVFKTDGGAILDAIKSAICYFF
jgi:hypothetical protein